MNWYKQQREAGKFKDLSKGFGIGVGLGLPFAAGLINQSTTKHIDPQQTQEVQEQPKKEEKPKASIPFININKIIQIESRGRANAVSPVGATGVMQIMPKTWNELVKKMGKNYTTADMKDRQKNIEVGTYYMNTEIPRLLRHFNVPDSVDTRLAAYNWGTGALSRAYQEHGENWLEHAPTETINYIQRYKQ